MILKQQPLYRDNLNNAFLSLTNTADQTIQSNLTVSGGTLKLKNSLIYDTAGGGFLRIDPQGNSVIIYDGVSDQQLSIYSSSSSEYLYLKTVNQSGNLSVGQIDLSGASVSQLNINTDSGKPVFIGGQLQTIRSGVNYQVFDSGNLTPPVIGAASTMRLTALQLNNNSTLTSGIYTNTGDGILNPNGTVFQTGWWHVIHSHHFDQNGFDAQIAIPLSTSSPEMYYRFASNGTWGTWKITGGGGVRGKSFQKSGSVSYSYPNGSVNAGVWQNGLSITGSGRIDMLYLMYAFPNGGTSAHFDTIFRVTIDGVPQDFPININGINGYNYIIFKNDGTIQAPQNQQGAVFGGRIGGIDDLIEFTTSLSVDIYTKSYSDGFGTYAPNIFWAYRT